MKTANLKSATIAALLGIGLLTGCTNSTTNQKPSDNMETLNLTQEWDKKFPQSNKVNHRKVTFRNRYGITLAADLYEPKNAEGKLAAIAVSGPFGAVKEQASGLYGRTWIPYPRIRPLLYGRKRRRTAEHCITRHQHGRFQRGS